MRIFPVGAALSLFFIIIYTACVLWGLIWPMSLHMHEIWEPFLPGFEWSIIGYLIGLVWVAFYGWLTAVIYVPLYNFFNSRSAK